MNLTAERRTAWELAVFGLLVVSGAGLRLAFQDLPNFAPVAALALFAGYYFRNWATALAVPVSVMLISDSLIGGYEWTLMLVVYASLSFPVALRGILRRRFTLARGKLASTAASLAGLVCCALGSSLVFFLTTNFACWLLSYDHTAAGLARCYWLALPFFRFTLAGDLLFVLALFGGYALAINCGSARQPVVGIKLASGSSRRQ